VTGTEDRDYDLIRHIEACLENALRLESYIQDATREGDFEVIGLFRHAQANSRKGAEMGRQLLHSWLTS
jgi:predicted metal-dependent HD superfamily phosphohydrolase